MQSLIPYTNKRTPATDKDIFKPFIKIFKQSNSSISDHEIPIIKQCIEEDDITAHELEYGFVQAYKDPDRYGKVEWNDIWKHIQILRNGKSGLGDNSKYRRI